MHLAETNSLTLELYRQVQVKKSAVASYVFAWAFRRMEMLLAKVEKTEGRAWLIGKKD